VREYRITKSSNKYFLSSLDYEIVPNKSPAVKKINPKSELDIGLNCGSNVVVSEEIIVVSCPTYSSGIGLISVFRESDRLQLKTIIGETGFKNIGTHMALMSISGKIDTLVFNSESTATNGVINTIEIFWNPDELYSYEAILKKAVLSDNTVTKFGKYFELISSKLYISSESSKSIQIVPFCAHNQNFVTNICVIPATNSLSLSYQAAAVTCQAYDQSVLYNRLLGRSLCNFNCSPGKFGQKCEDCTKYKAEIGEQLKTNYKWDLTNKYECVQTPLTGVDCSLHKDCVSCSMIPSCKFESGSCVSQTSTDVSWWKVPKENFQLDDHNTRYCGDQERDVGSLNLTQLKPRLNTPKNTFCNWKLISNAAFNLTISITDKPDKYRS
jgi:hypothetical protein